MKIIDISWPLSPDMTGYKDKKEVVFSPTRFYETDHVRESKIMMGCHAGTHVDAPSHMVSDGETIDQTNIEKLVGSALVVDLSHVDEVITPLDLEPFPISKNSILILKTSNSELVETAPFESKFVYLSKEAAEFCASKQVKAIGIDYLGIERGQKGHPSHKILMKAGITIVEGLRCADVSMGYYFFVCLPLRIEGLEASPARAILIQDI
jgi:arylformamidase